jgi:hypothetical protein
MCIDSTDYADNSRQIGINVSLGAESATAETDTGSLVLAEPQAGGLPRPPIAKLRANHLVGAAGRGKLGTHATARRRAECEHASSRHAQAGAPLAVLARTTLAREPSVAKDIEIEEPKAPAEGQRQQVQVDSSKARAAYANFCRVTGTPEELVIDFGLNTQPMGVPTEPIEIIERIVMNYFTAKRMLTALSMSVQRHEAAFGVLETDVQKRVVGGMARHSAT